MRAPRSVRRITGTTFSVQRTRNAEREWGNLGIERGPVLGHQLIAAVHGTDRCFKHGAAGVLEARPRRQRRLLADDAFTAHLARLAVSVGDDPVTREQLGRDAAVVGDGYGVGEYIAVLFRCRLARQVRGPDRNLDSWFVGVGHVDATSGRADILHQPRRLGYRRG